MRIIGAGVLLSILAFVFLVPYFPVYALEMIEKIIWYNSLHTRFDGTESLLIRNIPNILIQFSNFFSSYGLLLISLAFSVFYLKKDDRILAISFGLFVVVTCLLFREVFLRRVYSYYSVPMFSVISLCMWYFVLKSVSNVKSFLESKMKVLKPVVRISFCALGIILLTYLTQYSIKDYKEFQEYPYTYFAERYANYYDSLKWFDGQLPLGAKIVFGSKSPKPNPYLYNTKNPFDMGYTLEKYQIFFERYDYLFSGSGGLPGDAAAFVRESRIKKPDGLDHPEYNNFFSTGAANGVDTPYSKIAKEWILRYSESHRKVQKDWRKYIEVSLIKNGLFENWDINRTKYPIHFKKGGGNFLIERAGTDLDNNLSPVRLNGKRFIFTQAIQDYKKSRNQYVTLFVLMKTSIPHKFGISIYDGKNAQFLAHPGTGKFEEIALSFKVDEKADKLVAYIVNARNTGSENDIVEVAGAIMLPGKWKSLEEYQSIEMWQSEAKKFWGDNINLRPKVLLHWAIDWTEVDYKKKIISNQYFTYVPISRIPSLLTARHLRLIWPTNLNPFFGDEVIIEYQNISGIVLKNKHIKISDSNSANSLTIIEKIPFYETNIWGTNISNIKIIYKTISQKNKVFFPYVELY